MTKHHQQLRYYDVRNKLPLGYQRMSTHCFCMRHVEEKAGLLFLVSSLVQKKL